MFKTLAAAVLGSACLIAAPAVAQTAPKPPEPLIQNMNVMEGWLAESARWSQSHIALTQEAVAVVGQTMGAARQASEGFSDVDMAVAWAARQRAALESIGQRFARIPTAPPALPAGISETDRAEGETVRAISLEGYRSSRSILSTLSSKLDPMFDTIVSATRGDANARARVGREAIDLSILLVELENAMLISSPLPKGHPQRDVQDASIESNRAIIAMLEYQRERAAGRPADGRATAAVMRRQAELTRTAADTLRADIQNWQLQLGAGTGDLTMDARLGQVVALYVASVEVEHRVANALDGVAARVEAGDLAGIDTAYLPVAQAIQQRVGLDTSRRQAISAQ